jgi:hypothetical protein
VAAGGLARRRAGVVLWTATVLLPDVSTRGLTNLLGVVGAAAIWMA